jgi:PAS domain S-box-containing protein
MRRRDYRRSALGELQHDIERWNGVSPTPIEIAPCFEGRVSLVTPQANGTEFGRHTHSQPAEQAGTVEAFLRAAIATVGAIADLHAANVIHRNLKPSNIFVGEQGTLLLDPGSEPLLDEALRNLRCPYVTSRILPYLAPEQTGRMDRPIDERTDLYALGVTFFETLAGAPPFVLSDPLELIHAHLARRPPRLDELRPDLPEVLSAIVDRLLQKDPERRYQSARGLLYDLEACSRQQKERKRIATFDLGRADVPRTLVLDGTLYGRESELEQIETALDEACNGRPNLLLLSGPPGIGKSALARLVTRLAFVRKCHVGVGKCEQIGLEQPYFSLRQALTEIVEQVLFQQEEVLNAWRNRFQELMGGLGGAAVEMCPTLERIVGPQLPLPSLEPAEATSRLQLAMQRFIKVIATCGHASVLFLDDLQWADSGTLDLFDQTLASAVSLPLLIIGSYRCAEVSESHPVSLTIQAIKERGFPVRSCLLGPLATPSIVELLSNALGQPAEDVHILAEAVQKRTLGNPFFIRVFLQSMVARGALRFDGWWQWDLDEIPVRESSYDVVAFLVERMQQLAPESRRALEYAALLGNSTQQSDLMHALGCDLPTLLRRLEPAAAENLVRLREGRVTFLHDRVQEAAMAMISPDQLPVRHLEIAEIWREHLDEDKAEHRLFEHVSHLNAGRTALATSEYLTLARTNLRALEKAKRAAAFGTAFELARAGIECLGPSDWGSAYELCFALHREQAELTFFCGDYARAEALAIALEQRATNDLDRASARGLLVKQYIVQARFDGAIEAAREALSVLGVDLPIEESTVRARFIQERARSERLLDGREPGELTANAPMQSSATRLQLEILVRVNPAIFFRRPDMLGLNIVLMTNLSLEHGHTPVSAFAYAEFGFLCALESENYQRAYAFTLLGLQLADESLDPIQICRVTHLAAWIQHYTRPLHEADALYRKGFQAGSESGEMEWSAYHAYTRATRILLLGIELDAARREIEQLRDFVQRANSTAIVQLMDAVYVQIDFLTQTTSRQDLELRIDARLRLWRSSENPQAVFIFNSYRSFLLMLERRYDEAFDHAEQALELRQQAPNHPFLELARFVRGLSAVARLLPGAEVPRASLDEAARLESLAVACPENYRVRHCLIEAEIGRVRQHGWDNGQRYEQACRLAQHLKLVHEEGLAHQLAARFWFELGHPDFHETHLRRAKNCWRRWGARYLAVLADQYPPDMGASLGNLISHDGFDTRSLIKSSQAISSELDRSKLLSRVMHAILENAGAESGAFVSPGPHGLEIVVTAGADGSEDLTTRMLDDDPSVLVEVIRYAHRTGERVVLTNASADTRFSANRQVNQRAVRSVLCLPVGTQESHHGVLYLENPLVSGAFTADRLAVVEVLASQASISLENAALFARSQRAERTLRASEEDLRITLDSIGDAVIATDADGRLQRMNPVACRLTGFSLQQAQGLPLCEVLRTVDGVAREPADDLVKAVVRTAQNVVRSEDTIVISSNGAERRVAESGAPIRDAHGEIVGVVLVLRDVTERHEMEERFRQAQKMDLLGRLAGGIAHDFNNMLAGILGSAEVLSAKHKDSGNAEFRSCVKTIIDSALRAGDLTKQLLAFSRKGKRVSVLVDVHEVINEALTLLERSMDRCIRIERHFSDEALCVTGDPALLQSAILNLGINARDAMPNGGRLRVATRRRRLGSVDCEAARAYHLVPGDYVEIEVADNGYGMSPAVRSRMFEPFFTTKPAGKGTGLGLSAVHGTLVSHGGAIRVDSDLGQGTTVSLWMPYRQPIGRSAQVCKPMQPKDRYLRILVVDDEPVVRGATVGLVESLGHETLAAADGLEAVRCFEREHTEIDLVLLDAVMPNLNGADAFRRIREIEPDVPVVLVSGYARDATIDQLLTEGIDGFLMKPYTRASLISAIENAMDGKKGQFGTEQIGCALRIAAATHPSKPGKHA